MVIQKPTLTFENSNHTHKDSANGGAAQAASLKSATTDVDVSAATAPSLNQVLTATDSTHATWQTPAASSHNLAYVNKTGAYTTLITDEFLTGDATGGAFAISLITAVGNTGKQYWIKRTNSGANAVTVNCIVGGQTIDGAASFVLTQQYADVYVVSDGAKWNILATNIGTYN